MQRDADIIQQMTRRLVERFHPRQIILFGSWARGDQTPDSDVDFLVVVDRVADRRALRIAMRQAVNGMGLSKDIVLVSAEEFENKRNVPGSIVYPAAREGRILYAA